MKNIMEFTHSEIKDMIELYLLEKHGSIKQKVVKVSFVLDEEEGGKPVVRCVRAHLTNG